MLNITRRRDQKTIITVPPSATATTIVIDVPQIRHDLVKLGIDAPAEVVIDRDEVHADKLQRYRFASARPAERRYTLADAVKAQEAALRKE